MREDLRHYIDTSMGAETGPTYEMLGDGITALTENMNPSEETKHYINAAADSNAIKSYQRAFEVDKEDCVEDAVQEWIDDLVDNLPTGAKAKTSFVRLRLKDAVEGQAGVYKAIKVPCTVAVDSAGGDGGDYVHNVLNIKQCGDDIHGTFNVKDNTFTADAATTGTTSTGTT